MIFFVSSFPFVRQFSGSSEVKLIENTFLFSVMKCSLPSLIIAHVLRDRNGQTDSESDAADAPAACSSSDEASDSNIFIFYFFIIPFVMKCALPSLIIAHVLRM